MRMGINLNPIDSAVNTSDSNETWLSPTSRRLALVISVPILAQVLGSVFNIWYNIAYIQPILTPTQLNTFLLTIVGFNGLVYPVGIGLWAGVGLSLWQPCQQLLHQEAIAPEPLLKAQQRVINLPWWGIGLAAALWLLCIPVFLMTLSLAPGPLNPDLYWELPISFIIAALIAITHSFFTIELLSHRLLYPLLFQQQLPFRTPNTFPLNLRMRGLFLAFGGSICPIASLLLLTVAPHHRPAQDVSFALAVGLTGICFSLISTWMVEQLVIEPIKELQRAAIAVAGGDFKIRITSLRADEFGPLIDEINHMIAELQEKQVLQETFGRHVGEKAAEQILQRDPSLGGIEQELTVMFVDLRNFTRRCTVEVPQDIVATLNLFLSAMVEIVELQYGGMVNKFLGDGFMALFGVGEPESEHGQHAVAAAIAMLHSLEAINTQLHQQGQAPLAMGIGIHTGRAIVGSIGCDRRLEYTAIGDTVNLAARVEALTKTVGESILLTQATQATLQGTIPTIALPPQPVKGQPAPIPIFGLGRDGRSGPALAVDYTYCTLPKH